LTSICSDSEKSIKNKGTIKKKPATPKAVFFPALLVLGINLAISA
tara:strand:- start:680 stop:814 length:135 start_codon:yes stop_codon:yes gene_type:complete